MQGTAGVQTLQHGQWVTQPLLGSKSSKEKPVSLQLYTETKHHLVFHISFYFRFCFHGPSCFRNWHFRIHIKVSFSSLLDFSFWCVLLLRYMRSAVFSVQSELWGFSPSSFWVLPSVLFLSFHKGLVDFQPNKIVDTMNYMCLANWQIYWPILLSAAPYLSTLFWEGMMKMGKRVSISY